MKQVYAALAAARVEFARAAKDGTNPHLKNRYPTLAAIVDACDEALGRHGLTYAQPVVQTDAGPAVKTVLMHLDSGESIESHVPLVFSTDSKINPMQALGSAITYARRYGLESMLGLMREDDDGNGAYPQQQHQNQQRNGYQQQQPQRQQQQAPRQQQAAAPQDARPPQLFGVWVRAAAEQLGVGDLQLVNHLHDRAVKQALMPAVEPDIRSQALARRYYDRQKGREWRDWMRAECRTFQADLGNSDVNGGVPA
jgi:hypothetical protein